MSVTFKDNSKEAKKAMEMAIEAALTEIGIAAKHNGQKIIMEKDIYDSGKLHDTFDYNVRPGDKAVDVGSPKNYAIFNELGTTKMPSRPFLRPALLDNADEYKSLAAKTLGEAFNVSAGGLKTKSKYYADDKRVTNI